MKKKLLLLFLSILVISCNKQEIPNKDFTPTKLSYKISLDSLKAQALGLGELLGTPQTKGRKVSVKSVVSLNTILFPSNPTRSANADLSLPQAYVINFEDNAGFAILADDRRIGNNIFAYSENGNLDAMTANPGVLMFLEEADNYLAKSMSPGELIPEGGWPDNLPPYEPNRNKIPTNWGGFMHGLQKYYWHYYFQPTFSSQVSSLLKVAWHQKSPFNLECPIINGRASLAGCVAIAAVQLMSYHKFPVNINYNGSVYNINWDSAISSKDNTVSSNVSKLIKDIGDKVGMNYGVEASGASIAIIPFVFKHYYGYSESVRLDYYHDEKIRSELSQGRPVFLTGYNNQNVGHAWVVDGYKCFQTKSYYVCDYYDGLTARQYNQSIEGTNYTYTYYMSCNWGWGSNSGYFMDFNGYDYNRSMITIKR